MPLANTPSHPRIQPTMCREAGGSWLEPADITRGLDVAEDARRARDGSADHDAAGASPLLSGGSRSLGAAGMAPRRAGPESPRRLCGMRSARYRRIGRHRPDRRKSPRNAADVGPQSAPCGHARPARASDGVLRLRHSSVRARARALGARYSRRPPSSRAESATCARRKTSAKPALAHNNPGASAPALDTGQNAPHILATVVLRLYRLSVSLVAACALLSVSLVPAARPFGRTVEPRVENRHHHHVQRR